MSQGYLIPVQTWPPQPPQPDKKESKGKLKTGSKILLGIICLLICFSIISIVISVNTFSILNRTENKWYLKSAPYLIYIYSGFLLILYTIQLYHIIKNHKTFKKFHISGLFLITAILAILSYINLEEIKNNVTELEKDNIIFLQIFIITTISFSALFLVISLFL